MVPERRPERGRAAKMALADEARAIFEKAGLARAALAPKLGRARRTRGLMSGYIRKSPKARPKAKRRRTAPPDRQLKKSADGKPKERARRMLMTAP